MTLGQCSAGRWRSAPSLVSSPRPAPATLLPFTRRCPPREPAWLSRNTKKSPQAGHLSRPSYHHPSQPQPDEQSGLPLACDKAIGAVENFLTAEAVPVTAPHDFLPGLDPTPTEALLGDAKRWPICHYEIAVKAGLLSLDHLATSIDRMNSAVIAIAAAGLPIARQRPRRSILQMAFKPSDGPHCFARRTVCTSCNGTSDQVPARGDRRNLDRVQAGSGRRCAPLG